MSTKELHLMAHLMRRAGFGATREELEALSHADYEATVERLLDTDHPNMMSLDMMRRYNPENSGMIGYIGGAGRFATGYSKLCNGKPIDDQIQMFLRHGMGDLRTLLIELSKDPAMIVWLDNYENHKGSINENYGRELLELFSMGVGNYSEQDIKEASRALTGWTIGNAKYMISRAMADQDRPYGRIALHFEYHPEDHDDGEKEFLGRKGRFDGEGIVDIICEQEATARFISRHMYSFFVADEPPVPEWPHTPPRDPKAIEALSQTYFDSGYSIRAMLRVLLNSDFFKSEDVWYERVKGPAELMAGVLRLTKEFDRPRPHFALMAHSTTFMGQSLLNPESVEGWHWGMEWIDSGSLVERVNFVSAQLGDLEKPGVLAMVDGILSDGNGSLSPDVLVDRAFDQLALTAVSDETRSALIEIVEEQDRLEGADSQSPRERAASVLKMAATMPEFQRA